MKELKNGNSAGKNEAVGEMIKSLRELRVNGERKAFKNNSLH